MADWRAKANVNFLETITHVIRDTRVEANEQETTEHVRSEIKCAVKFNKLGAFVKGRSKRMK